MAHRPQVDWPPPFASTIESTFSLPPLLSKHRHPRPLRLALLSSFLSLVDAVVASVTYSSFVCGACCCLVRLRPTLLRCSPLQTCSPRYAPRSPLHSAPHLSRLGSHHFDSIGLANNHRLHSLSQNPPEPRESHSTRNGTSVPRGHNNTLEHRH